MKATEFTFFGNLKLHTLHCRPWAMHRLQMCPSVRTHSVAPKKIPSYSFFVLPSFLFPAHLASTTLNRHSAAQLTSSIKTGGSLPKMAIPGISADRRHHHQYLDIYPTPLRVSFPKMLYRDASDRFEVVEHIVGDFPNDMPFRYIIALRKIAVGDEIIRENALYSVKFTGEWKDTDLPWKKFGVAVSRDGLSPALAQVKFWHQKQLAVGRREVQELFRIGCVEAPIPNSRQFCAAFGHFTSFLHRYHGNSDIAGNCVATLVDASSSKPTIVVKCKHPIQSGDVLCVDAGEPTYETVHPKEPIRSVYLPKGCVCIHCHYRRSPGNFHNVHSN